MRLQKFSTKNSPKIQKGVVLIVGLIMVLLISIIALSSIRGSGLQEAMVGNMRDRGVSFQAAEAALSVGESYLRASTPPDCNGTVNNNFVCFKDLDNADPATSLQYATMSTFTSKGNTTSLGLTNIVSQPIYVVEELSSYQIKDDGSGLEAGGNPFGQVKPYRITAIGVGFSADAQVVVQSAYTTFMNN